MLHMRIIPTSLNPPQLQVWFPLWGGTEVEWGDVSLSEGWPYTNHHRDVFSLLMRPRPPQHFILKVFKSQNNYTSLAAFMCFCFLGSSLRVSGVCVCVSVRVCLTIRRVWGGWGGLKSPSAAVQNKNSFLEKEEEEQSSERERADHGVCRPQYSKSWVKNNSK